MSPSIAQTLALRQLISRVAQMKASALYLTAGNYPALRIQGHLVFLDKEPVLEAQSLKQILLDLLNEEQKKILAEKKRVTLTCEFENKWRFRVSIYYQRESLAASLFLIPQETKPFSELGLPSQALNILKFTKGLVLICGPYGSGRTTTAQALLNEINKRRKLRILTLEKPIEYNFESQASLIEQKEVGRDISSFKEGLEEALFEDFNVVYVSEVLDLDLVPAILNVATSSRLVITTLNSESILKTIFKLLAGGKPEERERIRLQLAESFQAVINQRLVPKIGGGLILVGEVFFPSSAIRSVIREGALGQLQNVLHTAREEAWVSLDLKLAQLVKEGKVRLEDALEQAIDPANIQSMVKR